MDDKIAEFKKYIHELKDNWKFRVVRLIEHAAQEYAENFDNNDSEEHIKKEIAIYIMNDGDLCSDLASLITERIFMINVGK